MFASPCAVVVTPFLAPDWIRRIGPNAKKAVKMLGKCVIKVAAIDGPRVNGRQMRRDEVLADSEY